MRYPRIIALRAVPHTAFLIAAIHLVAAISFLLLTPTRPAWTLGGLALTGVSLLASLRRARDDRVVALELGDDGRLRFPDRPDVEGRPCGRLADFGAVRWLEWREEPSGRLRALMLWRTACDAEDWRALGVWLRHRVPRGREGLSDAA